MDCNLNLETKMKEISFDKDDLVIVVAIIIVILIVAGVGWMFLSH